MNIDQLYDEVDRENGLPSGLTKAIAEAETGHIQDPLKRSSAVSNKGARGWMQIMPDTASQYGIQNPMDQEQSIRGGGRILGNLYRQFGSPELTAAAYNAGEGNVRKYKGIPPFDETRAYVPKVMGGMKVSGMDPFDELENQTKAVASQGGSDPFDDLETQAKPFRVIKKEEPLDLTNPNAGFLDNFIEGIGSRAKDRWIGAKQALNLGDPEELAHQARMAKLESNQVDKTAGGKTGRIAADIGGGLALGAGAALAAPAAATSPIWAPALATGGGMLSGLLEPTNDRAEAEKEIATQGVGGLLGYSAGPVLKKIAKPVSSKLSEEGARLAKLAQEKYGIELTPAMLTGSKPLKWLDSVFSDLPLTSGKQNAINENIHKQFNRAISSTWGGAEDAITPSVMKDAKERVGGFIDDLAERNTMNYDNQVLNDLAELKMKARAEYTTDQEKIINSFIDDLDRHVQNDGTVSGQAYRRLYSKAGSRMSQTRDGDLKSLLGDYRNILRNGMDRSISPMDSDAWAQARKQYGAIKTVEPLADKSTVGDISEGVLLNQANRGNNQELKDLGRIGKAFIKDMPNSGTAPRKFYQDLISNPVGTAIGSLAGIPSRVLIQNAIHSPKTRAYLTNGLLSEPNAQLVGNIGGLLGASAGPAIFPYLLNTESQQ